MGTLVVELSLNGEFETSINIAVFGVESWFLLITIDGVDILQQKRYGISAFVAKHTGRLILATNRADTLPLFYRFSHTRP